MVPLGRELNVSMRLQVNPNVLLHTQKVPTDSLTILDRVLFTSRPLLVMTVEDVQGLVTSRSHTRSKSEQVLPSSDPCAPAIPVIPLRWRQQRPAPIPNAIPPGYPAGTTWVLDSGGWPQLKVCSLLPTSSPRELAYLTFKVPESLTGHVNASPHTAIRDREQRQSQFCPPIDHSRHLGPIAHHEDSNRLSRANLTNAYDLPRRSRSQSRSRSDQVAPLFDVTAPPVPSIPPRTGRQQKQFLIPDAIPPGYPDGTRWIVGSSGWPQLETPDQFRERYGISSPAVAPARESPYKHGRDPHAPVIASPSPQKPMFKRIFGGILGGNKRAGTPGPTQAPPANQDEPQVENEEFLTKRGTLPSLHMVAACLSPSLLRLPSANNFANGNKFCQRTIPGSYIDLKVKLFGPLSVGMILH
ncbi:hypothetical protein DL96DRAFT_1565671 [Flagelloscypha sp. PMI_526]|nr:hypothetical protein DL96DRAFT_1565671 [Flagelloscypha sp. PMI_526]